MQTINKVLLVLAALGGLIYWVSREQALAKYELQVKALAAEYKVKDGPGDDGNMFERPGRPADQPCGVRAFFLRLASLRLRFTLGFS